MVLVRCNGTVVVAHCTCMAGLAETCSHVGPVLLWLETTVRIRNDTHRDYWTAISPLDVHLVPNAVPHRYNCLIINLTR